MITPYPAPASPPLMLPIAVVLPSAVPAESHSTTLSSQEK
jgi:hypothetical protein